MKKWKDQPTLGKDFDLNTPCRFIVDLLNVVDCPLSTEVILHVCRQKGLDVRMSHNAIWHLATENFVTFTPDWKVKIV